MALLLLLLAALVASAQVNIRPGFSVNGPTSVTVTPSGRTLTAVTGLPWSGVQTSERVLSNGTQMDVSTTRTFRDSMGRIRTEHSGQGFGTAVIVEIDDPTGGHIWVLDPVNEIAHRLALKSTTRAGSHTLRPCPVSGAPVTSTTRDGGTSVSESLGSKTIEGISACGSRNTITRKDQTVSLIAENWFSSEDFGGVLLTRLADPRGSTATTQVGNVKFDEPDAGLFEAPAVYRVVDETAEFTMVIGAAPAKPAPPVPGARPFTALTGMPYSAELLSGTTILNRQYRDSMGRTRNEPVAAGLNLITDPVAGFRYSIDTAAKTVHRTPIPSVKSIPATEAVPPPTGPSTQTLSSGVTALNESLGMKTIDGIDTYGMRVTLTYPPGTMGGNDKTFTAVNEFWFSPKLGESLLTRSSGALSGDSGSTLANLKYTEPDPSLFQIPDGYQVIDGK